ncbi:MAG: HPr family phosphocarrier protein [Anaerolineae bacterium]|nr:HPr family phosphocarrier protein [Anaerolineae bacterium]
MYSRQTKVINKTGLHARPASDLVLKAKGFESEIKMRNLDDKNAELINLKSIMKILAAGILSGTSIEISADGCDEKKAVDSLVDLVESGFGDNKIVEE